MDGEVSIARVVAFREDRQYDRAMAQKVKLPKTKWGDAIGCLGPRPLETSMAFRARKWSPS